MREIAEEYFPRGRYSSNLGVSYCDDGVVEGSILEIPLTLSFTSRAWL